MSNETAGQSEFPKRQPAKKRGGRWIVIGEEQLQVPPLAFGQIVTLQDDVESLKALQSGGRPTNEQMSVVNKLVHSALSRNYPDITEDEVAEMIDLGNYSEVLSAVLSIAGFTKEKRAGEVPAA